MSRPKKKLRRVFPQIIGFENLLSAAVKAARGKRENRKVMAFFLNLEDNICQLQEELEAHLYCPGEYRTFHIYEPKARLISAAPFRDRVAHHGLMNVIGPPLERRFIYDSYSNRVGKGTHAAIRRYQVFLNRFFYVLKCDIKSYFPSIDHELLKEAVRERISCSGTLWLIDTIIDGSNPQPRPGLYFPGDTLFTPFQRRLGLPIGNLTSQFFANYYLDPLDHYVKEVLGCKGYVRYVDDFVLFADSKPQLWRWKKNIDRFLLDFRLKLHPKRCHIFPSTLGYPFLGQVVFPTHRRLVASNVRRFKKRLRRWRQVPPENLGQRLASWRGHAEQADSVHLLRSLGLIEDK